MKQAYGSGTQNLSEKLSMVILEENPTPVELYEAITLILISFTPEDLDLDMVELVLDVVKKSVLDVIAIGE